MKYLQALGGALLFGIGALVVELLGSFLWSWVVDPSYYTDVMKPMPVYCGAVLVLNMIVFLVGFYLPALSENAAWKQRLEFVLYVGCCVLLVAGVAVYVLKGELPLFSVKTGLAVLIVIGLLYELVGKWKQHSKRS